MDHISRTDYVTVSNSIYLPDYAKWIVEKRKAIANYCFTPGPQAAAESVTNLEVSAVVFAFIRSHFFLRLANQKTSIVCHSLGQNPYHRENGSRLFPFQKYLSCHFVVAIICLYLFKLKPLYFVEFHAI